MPDIGTPEILIIVAVILLLFGATKLPTFARSLGRSMRIFKSEIKGIDHDDEPAKDTAAKPEPAAEPQQLARVETATENTTQTTTETTEAAEPTEPAASRQPEPAAEPQPAREPVSEQR